MGHQRGRDLLLNGFWIISTLAPNLLCHITFRKRQILWLMFVTKSWSPFFLVGSRYHRIDGLHWLSPLFCSAITMKIEVWLRNICNGRNNMFCWNRSTSNFVTISAQFWLSCASNWVRKPVQNEKTPFTVDVNLINV